MIVNETFDQVSNLQREALTKKDNSLYRSDLQSIPQLLSHALIISGIRRCGKSTLLNQLLESKYPDAFFLNFEDPRLRDFEKNDFLRLDEVITASGKQVLFFDEIQVIPEWERYIRQKLDENYRLVVTGSNASLLSKELGTKLTGRYLMRELFPFSFEEYCSFKTLTPSIESCSSYLQAGGFPEYLKTNDEEILQRLFDDILMRDIVVRYGIRDVRNLQKIALFLISNVGKPITGNKLKTTFELNATSTVMEYLSHLEMSYLFYFLPKFSYSLKKQAINPRKVYVVDNGMINANSYSFSGDEGRKFENMIFLHLRRQAKEIYYFAEKQECDFIVCKRGQPKEAIQVCLQLTQDNIERELKGLSEALEFLHLNKGILVTLKQTDSIKRDGKVIDIVPVHQFLKH